MFSLISCEDQRVLTMTFTSMLSVSLCINLLFSVVTLLSLVDGYVIQKGGALDKRSNILPSYHPPVGVTANIQKPTQLAYQDNTGGTVCTTTAPWRIALNIGQTKFDSYSSSWPIVLKCDFLSEQNTNRVATHEPTVRYTLKTGEVTKPVEGGTWKLEPIPGEIQKKLTFSLTFPDEMVRNELSLPAGTTVTCESLVYTQEDLKFLNDNFYQAREETWAVGSELNTMNKWRNAPKAWNMETNKWEKPKSDQSILSFVKKRMQYAKLKQAEQRESAKRPDPNTLSTDGGIFPGMDRSNRVFVVKNGVLRRGSKVIGTWAAEPVKYGVRP